MQVTSTSDIAAEKNWSDTIDHAEVVPPKRHDRGEIAGTRTLHFILQNFVGTE